jgi:mannose/fructose/N-acetylgalactosamine-specific phosphotransferase system component IID
LRQAIDSAINNYASLFERQGRYTRIIGHNEYLEAREMKAYEIDTAIVAGVKTTLSNPIGRSRSGPEKACF